MANLDVQGRKLLLVSNGSLNLADYISLVSLINVLKEQATKVDLLITSALSVELTDVVALPTVNQITEIPVKRYLLTLTKGPDTVSNIQWQQNDSQVTFYVSMQSGQFLANDLELKQEGADYDIIVYFQITSFSEVEKYFATYPELVYQVRHISIGGKFTIDNQAVELIDAPTSGLIAEAIYAQLDTTKLTADAANLFLASVLSATNNFAAATAANLRLSAELLEKGASMEAAQQILNSPKLVS